MVDRLYTDYPPKSDGPVLFSLRIRPYSVGKIMCVLKYIYYDNAYTSIYNTTKYNC